MQGTGKEGIKRHRGFLEGVTTGISSKGKLEKCEYWAVEMAAWRQVEGELESLAGGGTS